MIRDGTGLSGFSADIVAVGRMGWHEWARDTVKAMSSTQQSGVMGALYVVSGPIGGVASLPFGYAVRQGIERAESLDDDELADIVDDYAAYRVDTHPVYRMVRHPLRCAKMSCYEYVHEKNQFRVEGSGAE